MLKKKVDTILLKLSILNSSSKVKQSIGLKNQDEIKEILKEIK